MKNDRSEPPERPARRALLTGSGVLAFGGMAGAAFGYKMRDPILEWRGMPVSSLPKGARHTSEFDRRAKDIYDRQARQTVETVKQLKAKYESPIYGRESVWTLIERLGLCIDTCDPSLMLTSQYAHVQQVLDGMERDGIKDKDLFLMALLHDLGKVMLLESEAPEHVVGAIVPVGEYTDGIGLSNVILQFGHDEIIYSRIKDHVPEHIAWTVRYHSIRLSATDRYLDDRERAWRDRYLTTFQSYDLGSKSYSHFPRVDMAKYRALIEDTFPHPILF